MLVWKKLASAKWEDAWLERLAFLGPTRLAIVGLPGRKSLRIEAYGLTRREADALLDKFGGQIRQVKDKPISEPVARKPLAIRNQLLVVQSKQAACNLALSRPVLVIPAAMAFGTGGHATTACCLRLLCDLAREQERPWDFLDLGCGSGILAIAAKKLGARRVQGCDFDPHAVRTAIENVALNGAEPLAIRKTDVLNWTPRRVWDVVAANLFSQVLIAASPAITAAVRPGGCLILSGILRTQEAEVAGAYQTRGFLLQRTVRMGKWVTLLSKKG